MRGIDVWQAEAGWKGCVSRVRGGEIVDLSEPCGGNLN